MSKFSQLAEKIGKKPGIKNPKGVAYAIGVAKYGKVGMQKKAAAGRKKAAKAKGS